MVLQVLRKVARVHIWSLCINTWTHRIYFCRLPFHFSLEKKIFCLLESFSIFALLFPFDRGSISVPFALSLFTYISLFLLCSPLTSCLFFCLNIYVFFHFTATCISGLVCTWYSEQSLHHTYLEHSLN